MALQVKVGSFTLPNVIGNVSVASVGFQPEAVMFFSPGDVGFNVNYARMYGGMGFAVGTAKQVCMSWFSRAAVDPSITASQITNNRIYVSIDNVGAGAPFIAQQSSLISMDPLGFTVSSTVAGNPDLICYIAFAGLTGADCGITSLTALGPDNTVTTGFTPDLLLFGSSGLYNAVGSLVDDQTSFFGVEDGSGRHSTSWYRKDNVADNVQRGGTESSANPIQMQDLTGAVALQASVSFLADGFTMNKGVNPASNQNVLYMALGGLKTKIGTFLADEPSVGSKVITGVGFQPVGGLFHSRYFTPTTGKHSNRFTFGAQTLPGLVATNEGKSVSWNGNDSSPSSVEDRTNAQTGRAFAAFDATTALESFDISSWDADGFTVRNKVKNISVTFPATNLFYTVFQEGTNNNFIPISGSCLRQYRCQGSLGFLVGEYEPFCINTCGQILTEAYDDVHEKIYDLGVDYLDFSIPDTLLIQEFANFTYRDDPIDVLVTGSDDPLFTVSDQETYSVQAVDLVGPEGRDLVTSLGFTTMRRYWKITIITALERRVIVGDIFLGKAFYIDRSPKYPATMTVRDEFIEARRFPLDIELEFSGVTPFVKQLIDEKLIEDGDIVPFWLYDPQDAVLFGRLVHKCIVDNYNATVNESGVFYDITLTLEELI